MVGPCCTPIHTIFVVEDDDSVRNYVEIILVRLGYRVIVASDGPGALARLPETPNFDMFSPKSSCRGA